MYLLELCISRKVTAHVHSGPLPLQHSSAEQQTDQGAVLTRVNDELIAHLVLSTTLLRVVQEAAHQDVQNVLCVQFLSTGPDLWIFVQV